MASSKTKTIIKAIVAVLAVLNLVALFVFDYSLPSLKKSKAEEAPLLTETVLSSEDQEQETEAEVETVPDAASAGWKFTFDSDTLEYDGTGELDLTSGVALTGPDGNSEIPVYVNIVSGATLNQKVIQYTASTPNGTLLAERNLTLIGYEGPTISIPQKMPDIAIDSLDTLISSIADDDDYYAYDGYGNGITSKISVEFTMPESGNIVHAVFSITNMFNDIASAAIDFEATLTKPVITLSTTDLTLQAGQPFVETDYLRSAIDVDGSNISANVTVMGVVDSSVPGDYQITYTCSAPSGQQADPVVMTIHVVQ